MFTISSDSAFKSVSKEESDSLSTSLISESVSKEESETKNKSYIFKFKKRRKLKSKTSLRDNRKDCDIKQERARLKNAEKKRNIMH